jgi:putative aldouronate transport system permease protein
MMKLSRGEKLFEGANVFVLGLVALLCLYPFIYTLSISLSSATEASRDGFHFFPKDVSLISYKVVLSNPNILTGYVNTVMRTVVGTVLTLLLTCVAAYPLSRREMPHRSMITFIIVFTMLFNGGMVPGYLLIKKLGMINSMWALVLPSVITAFNVIIVKNFFQS